MKNLIPARPARTSATPSLSPYTSSRKRLAKLARFALSLSLTTTLSVVGALAPVMPARAGSYEDFFFYIERDYPSGIKDLVARGFDPNTPDANGQMGIMRALQDGELKAADAIASSPGFNVEAVNKTGETALMMAALNGRLDWVKRLVAMGAKIDRPGWSPVLYAAAGPEPEVLKFLLEKGAPINGLSPNGTTPLMMAAQYGAIDGATLLLERGADPNLRNSQGWTAIDFAQRAERDRLARAIDAAAAKAEPAK